MLECRLNIDDIKNLNRKNYFSVVSNIRRIVVSSMSNFYDLNDYLEDIVSNSFIVLLKSTSTFDDSKSKFSSYAYNKIVSSSKKYYHTLKYPYSGIKALMGYSKERQQHFFDSSASFIESLDDLELEFPGTLITEEEVYMFLNNSFTYKFITAAQEIGSEFKAGYVVEKLDSTGRILSQFFSTKTKNQIVDDIKRQCGFKTEGQKLIEKTLGEMEV